MTGTPVGHPCPDATLGEGWQRVSDSDGRTWEARLLDAGVPRESLDAWAATADATEALRSGSRRRGPYEVLASLMFILLKAGLADDLTMTEGVRWACALAADPHLGDPFGHGPDAVRDIANLVGSYPPRTDGPLACAAGLSPTEAADTLPDDTAHTLAALRGVTLPRTENRP